MSRHSSYGRRWIRPVALLFPILMAVVAWFAIRGSSLSSSPPSSLTSATSTVPSVGLQVLLARSRPDLDHDDQFVYDVQNETLTATSSPAGWRIPVTTTAHISRRGEDSVWILTDDQWSVVLRDARGHAYQDPLLVGEFDDMNFAVAAVQSDRRLLLRVSRNGSIHELTNLSEQTVPLTAGYGHVWLVETPPREGIEVPIRGPSRVWSVDFSGVTSTPVVDERVDAVITDVFENDEDIAFVSDRGDVRVLNFSRESLSEPVLGTPLFWFPDGRLLLVREQRVCVFLPSTKTTTCRAQAPQGLRWAKLIP